MLASPADYIIVPATGLVGSIGIIALHRDQSGADAIAGLKYTAIYAGDRKNDGNPHVPLTPAARNEMQSRVDRVYGLFTTAVARNRGLKEAAIRGTQAAVFMGQTGVDAGLADGIGTMADAQKLLIAAIGSGSKSIFSAASSAAKTSVASATRPGEIQPMAEVTQPSRRRPKYQHPPRLKRW
ncbi:MAG: S49 family peptidase [Ignavibacteriota bacterium]